MEELIALMLAWLSSSLGLPSGVDPPAVAFVAPEVLVQVRYGSAEIDDGTQVIALYDDESQTVLLQVGWDGRDTVDSSVLLHELVHHVQNVAGLTYPCPAAREELAYQAQAAWLQFFGHDLEDIIGLSEPQLRLTYVCLPL